MRRVHGMVLVALVLGCRTEQVSGPSEAAGPSEPPSDAPVYRFGSKFEPPLGRVVHGMGQWGQGNAKYQALLPAGIQPASSLLFLDIGDTPRGWLPGQTAAWIASQAAAGMIPHVDIALRGLQPGPQQLAQMADKLYGIDDEIANGSAYDGRILDLVQIARAHGGPIMMRIGGEFSGSWNGYHPWDFPRAFRRIVELFRAGGAHNVAFIWCYMPAAPGDFDERNAAGEWKWYPGGDVVDWFGIDWFNEAEFSDPGSGRGSDSSYSRSIRFLDMAVASGRPVIVAESSPAPWNLGDPAQAGAAWEAWFAPYFALIETRPEIEWFHYINHDWTQAGHYAAMGWKNADLTANAALSQKYVAELSAPKYLHAGELALLKDYTTYQ